SDTYRLRNSDLQGVSYQVYSRLDPPNTDSFTREATPLTAKQHDMYLRLPATDARIPLLARNIAAFERTHAGQARALEKYLRTRYGYTLDLPQSEPADP